MLNPKRAAIAVCATTALLLGPSAPASASLNPGGGGGTTPSCGSACYITESYLPASRDTAYVSLITNNHSSRSWCFLVDEYVIGTGHHYYKYAVGAYTTKTQRSTFWPAMVLPAYDLLATYPTPC